jgi:pimeloyl-ACP methyl ester carboxylesterase
MQNTPFKSNRYKLLYEKSYDDFAMHWPVPSECQTVETSFGTSYVRISGFENTNTIVLLQGAASTSLMWSNIVLDLVKTGYKVVAIDNIHEFGRSYYSEKISTTSDLVDWLDQTLKHLGITDNIELMGLSFGGWLCAQYCLSHFPRIRRITLLAPFMAFFWPRFGVFPRLIMCAIPLPFFRKQFCFWIFNNAYHGNVTARTMAERWLKEFNIALKCFRIKSPAKMDLLGAEQFKKIQTKTGIILGLQDRAINSQKTIEALKNIIFTGDVNILTDAGHDLACTHTQNIIDFLTRK